MASKTPKPAMTLEEIAEVEGLSTSAVRLCLSRALLKLRRDGLVMTCREMAQHLDANRATEHTVRRTARGR
jgi:DNA-binding IscR family transcriptional regulator